MLNTTRRQGPKIGLLLKMRAASEIETLISALPGIEWRPLGERPNNFPVVNVGADPGDALIERVTNGMDALIEREMALQGMETFSSPRRAVEALFGIPQGRLTNAPSTQQRRELATQLSITLRDGAERTRPTVIVRDHGIGQHPEDFPRTLLSLNESNKVNRPELMGAFGQGGAAVFAFARYTLIISRRDPALLEPSQDDLVGWTVVRFNPLDENFKHGVYEYMVVPGDRGGLVVPTIEASELKTADQDFVGCHFALIEYQLDRYSDVAFRSHGSLWHLLQIVLFDPIYPILLRDERVRAVKANKSSALNGVVVSGNATRLEEDKRKKLDHHDTHVINLGDAGTAMVRYFVIKDKGDAKSNWELMRGYVSNELAVTITLNGQRQGSMRRDVFNRLGLLSISKEIIVQVDCDGLSKRAKWELFSTTRDRIKDSPLATRLENEIRNAIGSDEHLRKLDKARKQRALARQSETETKKIQDWLKRAIAGLKPGLQQTFKKIVSNNTEYQILGDQPLIDEVLTPPIEDPAEEIPLSEVPDEPTELRVLNPVVRVPVGGTGVVRLAMNAPDDYVSPEPGLGRGDLNTQFTKGANLFQMTGYSAIRRGVLRATISAVKGTQAGDKGRVIFAVTRPSGTPLFAEAEIVAIDPPTNRAKPSGKLSGVESGPKVVGIDREGWHLLGLSENIVSRLEEEPANQTTTIYVFKEYPRLMERLRISKLSEEDLVHYQSKFVAALALATWLQHDEQKRAESHLDDDVANAELRRAAEMFLFSQFVVPT